MAPDASAHPGATVPPPPNVHGDLEHEQRAAAAAARARAARASRRRRSFSSKTTTYVLLVIGALIVLFPIYVLVVDSLLPNNQIFTPSPVLFPTHPAWSNYSSAFSEFHFGLYLKNSVIQTLVIVSAQLVTSVLAAYAFVFLRFPFRRTLFMLVLATVMIPFEVTVVTNLTTVRSLGWDGSFLGLTVPFFATGFGIFLMRQAFLGIPKELKEASVIDGLGPMKFLWRIAIPLTRPVIAALAVFSFLGAWNQYLWPSLLTDNPAGQNIRTAQIGLGIIGGDSATAGIGLAAAVVSLAPLVILLIFFRKNLIRSLTAGAVK
jgi:sn-glycerol 3-phosphate transport system permease protein